MYIALFDMCTRQLIVAGISRFVAKSGRAEVLKLLLWTGIFEILAEALTQGEYTPSEYFEKCAPR